LFEGLSLEPSGGTESSVALIDHRPVEQWTTRAK
jgi:hypothetical protein